MNLKLSSNFRQTITTAFGNEGKSWLDSLPELIARCERRWSLTVCPPFQDLSYNFVAPASYDNGRDVVLKLGVPRQELLTEAEALRHYDGRGSVRLLGDVPGEGILLLERLRPGKMLADLWPDEDEKATRIAGEVMRRLWRPKPDNHSLITFQHWFKGFGRLRRQFNGGSGPFPSSLVDKAEKLYAELQDSMSSPLILHGDLHHFNILSAEREPWLAIDPKGVVGEAEYEIGALLRNPVGDMYQYPQILKRRIAILTEMLNLDGQRVIGWAIAQAVLSAWWSYEDHGYGWKTGIALAETLNRFHQ